MPIYVRYRDSSRLHIWRPRLPVFMPFPKFESKSLSGFQASMLEYIGPLDIYDTEALKAEKVRKLLYGKEKS